MHLQYGCSVGKHFILKLKKIEKRSLEVIYGIDDSYNNLLLRSNSVSIHQRHLRFLVTEILKAHLKSTQNSCGRSLNTKSYPII